MAQSKLEKLRAENKELKDAEEIQALEKENKHLKCVADRVLSDGTTKVDVAKLTVSTVTKGESMKDAEERGRFYIEALAQVSPAELDKLSYEDFAIYRDIVQGLF